MNNEMTINSGAGKSDVYRQVDYKKYDANYERIFRKKCECVSDDTKICDSLCCSSKKLDYDLR